MKGLINFESIWRRSLKALGLYNRWLLYREKHFPNKQMLGMRNVYSQFVTTGSLCFDVGANMGSRIASLLMLGAKVIALEPQEQCLTELRKLYSNKPVTIIGKGVGAFNETKKFYVSSNPLVSSFSEEWIEGMSKKLTKDRWDKTVQMEIVTLDSLIAEYGKPDFIKIDTEGFELEVLKGLNQPVKALSFEYTIPEPGNKTILCIDRINELYSNKAVFNICRDEEYKMKFDEWITGAELKKLIENPSFNTANFGNYGDIYVKLVQ